jgi:hypothetical protein
MATQIQFRRGNASQWSGTNPILAQGEIGYELDTHLFKFGDGSSIWTSLPYVTSSLAITASYALNGGGGPSTPQTSCSWASQSLSASCLIGSTQASNIILTNTASNYTILSQSTSSISSAFFNYVAASGSNIRAGHIIASWYSTTMSYTEYTNADIGDTSNVSMAAVLNQNYINLTASCINTSNWSVSAKGSYV